MTAAVAARDEAPVPAERIALEARGIRKAFGPLLVNDDVSFRARAGGVYALVGENGAGKSTLMNVLYGLYQPDAGEILIDGAPVRMRSPRDAIAHGLGMVHQHFMLVPPLTVAENVVLGAEPRTKAGLLDRRAAEDRVAEVAARYGFALDPKARVEQISVGMQQRVEIVKALYRGARILILDEPTAVLTPQEAEELFGIVRRLRGSGAAVLLIAHKLREVMSVASRIGVLRRGRLVAQREAHATSEDELTSLMIGGAVPQAERSVSNPGAPVLEVRGLGAHGDRKRDAVREVSFTLREGEIVGVAGVDGNGQSELREVLCGLRGRASGEIALAGASLPADPEGVRRAGLRWIPEDRQSEGLVLDFTVAENLTLGDQRRAPFARGRVPARVDFAGREANASARIAQMDVRPPDPKAKARALSGGNQQKVILAREIHADPKVLVAMQPTRGLDVGATARIHSELRRLRAAGRAVLLISLDLDELLSVCDRILVLCGGRVAGIVDAAQATPELLGRMMLAHAEAPRG